MSTTPMHRPFLVGTAPARSTRPYAMRPYVVRRGLHVVPAPDWTTKHKNRSSMSLHKMVAVAAALLLVLAI